MWMGSEIHNLASFNFRHDSRRNPPLELYQKKHALTKGLDKKLAAEAAIPEKDLIPCLIRKIR